jgi:hypothetical protein
MKKGRNTAEIIESDDSLDDMESSNSADQERVLILKAAPPSRKAQLIAHGVKEIRCIRCDQIGLLAAAEESEDGWLCEHCTPKAMKDLRYSGKKRR